MAQRASGGSRVSCGSRSCRTTTWTSRSAGTLRFDLVEERCGTRRRGGDRSGPRDHLSRKRRRAPRRGWWCRCGGSHGCAARGARAASAGSAAVRSSAWIWVFSSTHSTTAASGGFRYSPTMSRTLSMNCGSGDSLNESVQMRLQPERTPDSAHRRLGHPRRVRHRTRRPMRRIRRCLLQRLHDHPLDVVVADRPRRPGRGSSCSPSSRRAANRRRHLLTVRSVTPRRAATSRLVAPSAHANTIRQRNASA